ncbi:hypothetical protein [Actinomadura macrotermitis]|uniref:Lipoprotein n=1 Tax=Actinomadura macrotermitis TaxID=2585200 RepID=A0A7K0BRC1_9ACTN|nr:hypothetical protein [Actinomadura macrotermitis]MQY03576.1 hypothetical protein [Actinomadura macrotermitis]
MRARYTGVLAMVLAAGLAGCSSSDGKSSGGGPAKGPVVATDSSVHAGQQVELKNAEYVKIAGLADQAMAQKLDAALRGPLDWAVKWAGATLEPEQKKQCGGRNSVIQTKVRIGLRGEIVSATNAVQMIPCYEGEGQLPTIPVVVDTKAGKALTASDILTDKALDKDGLKDLFGRLQGPKEDWKECDLGDLQRGALFPAKENGDPIESPPAAGLMFTPQGLELIWSTTGTDCNNFVFSAGYDKIKDLVRPELFPRLQSAAAVK